jgi:hypothetical protein
VALPVSAAHIREIVEALVVVLELRSGESENRELFLGERAGREIHDADMLFPIRFFSKVRWQDYSFWIKPKEAYQGGD